MRWGRYTPVLEASSADLVVAVRRGSKASALNPTIDGAPRDNRPVVVEGSDGAAHIGIQQGRPAGATDPGLAPSSPGPSLSTQGGALKTRLRFIAGALPMRWSLRRGAIWPRMPSVRQTWLPWTSSGRLSSKLKKKLKNRVRRGPRFLLPAGSGWSGAARRLIGSTRSRIRFFTPGSSCNSRCGRAGLSGACPGGGEGAHLTKRVVTLTARQQPTTPLTGAGAPWRQRSVSARRCAAHLARPRVEPHRVET